MAMTAPIAHSLWPRGPRRNIRRRNNRAIAPTHPRQTPTARRLNAAHGAQLNA
ncbi:hypothetical protein J2X16_000755 [Pelomonas aquatica]|uniref:Uncharacterized protein n=1 Tax=Pelomonas aquatica TaxID=431058 RepID=A0ABU1Z490_9BURK|nr:hypothetical protein [Pelomonas aquatica]